MAQVTIIDAVNAADDKFKLRCAAYCRVSTDKESQRDSYTAQVNYYSELFKNSQTETLTDIYADEGISAVGEDRREEFKRMIADCRKGKIDRIYTKSISRFARNTRDCLKNIRELKSLGITVFFEKENIDTSKMTDEMMITVMGGLAQEESVSISRNVQWAIQKRMQNGTFLQSVEPYGYRIVDRKFVICEEEAKIVREIYQMYLNGMGLKMIVTELNRRKTPCRHAEQWNRNGVAYILSNEKYIGDCIWQKCYTDGFPGKMHRNKGEKDMYYVADTHEAIIDRQTFEKVQTVLNAHKFKIKNTYPHVMCNKMYCGICGAKFRRIIKRNNFWWSCSMHIDNIKLCHACRMPEYAIESAFMTMCKKLKQNRKTILISLWNSLNELRFKKIGGDIQMPDIYKQIADLKEQKHVLSVLKSKGLITSDKYMEQTSELDSKIIGLNRYLKKMRDSDEGNELLDKLDILIDTIEKMPEDICEFDGSIFEMICDRITILENGYAEFTLICGLKLKEMLNRDGK